MKLIRQIIKDNYDSHRDFSYYELLIDEIENNLIINPDISIESCKSFIEGISKAILKSLDIAYKNSEIDALDFQPLFKRAITKLSEYNEHIEYDFIVRACSIIHYLGEIRNRRGDISHGKLAPKIENSQVQFSKLVAHVTEAISYYILEQFFLIDLSFKQPIIYKDNAEFNSWLDELNPIGNLSYSKALFDQDIITYEEGLTDYLANKEIEKL